MGHPWNGPRHRSWASDTAIFAAVFVVIVVITALSDYLNGPADPPAYLVGLCGAAGSALFGAASSDKSKREREIVSDAATARNKASTVERRTLTLNEDQIRTERKVDDLLRFARDAHPDTSEALPETLLPDGFQQGNGGAEGQPC